MLIDSLARTCLLPFSKICVQDKLSFEQCMEQPWKYLNGKKHHEQMTLKVCCSLLFCLILSLFLVVSALLWSFLIIISSKNEGEGVKQPQPSVTGCIGWKKKWSLVTNTRWRSNKGTEGKKITTPCFLNHQVSLNLIQNPVKERRSIFHRLLWALERALYSNKRQLFFFNDCNW